MAGIDWTAAGLYGAPSVPQPSPAPGVPTHPAGTPEPVARTEPRPTGLVHNPTLALVVILGLALWLIHFSIGFSTSVHVGD